MLLRACSVAVAFAVVTVVVCGGCSSSSSGGGSPNSCTSTFNALCQRACACGGASACNLVEVTDAGPGASIGFNNLSGCEELYDLTCGMPGAVRSDFDYAGCTSAVQASACVASPGGGMGVAYPAICNPNSPVAIDAGID
jgi:hypothetical protein